MATAQEYGLETVDERLRRISVTMTLCLGSKVTMTAERILGKMTDEEIIDMFNDNIDTQYILPDHHGYEAIEEKARRDK